MHEARRLIVPVTTVESWLDRQALALERGARMMAAVGTAGFFEQGRQLYGEPTAPLRYIHLMPLALAQSVLDTITQLTKIEIRTEPPAYHSAETVAAQLADAVRVHFGEQAPAIERAGSAETTVGSRDRDPDGDRRADFLEVYAFFMERTGDADQAFESARRVFRGGVLTGGAPFTKDVVYLMGLMSVNYFIRVGSTSVRSSRWRPGCWIAHLSCGCRCRVIQSTGRVPGGPRPEVTRGSPGSRRMLMGPKQSSMSSGHTWRSAFARRSAPRPSFPER